MSNILMNKSGKGGPSCSYSVDVQAGCNNGCIGCYASYTSRIGPSNFHNNIKKKDFNYAKFISSVNSARKKGMAVYRIGKHTDCYISDSVGKTLGVIEATTKAGIRSVSISKSIKRSRLLAKIFDNNNILHISAGLLCNIKNSDRIATFSWYKRNGANVKLRITDDVTSKISNQYIGFMNSDVIITPIRFKSRHEATLYNVDINNYEYIKGFWRPKFIHSSWKYTNFCGEIAGKVLCCNCLLSGDCK